MFKSGLKNIAQTKACSILLQKSILNFFYKWYMQFKNVLMGTLPTYLPTCGKDLTHIHTHTSAC